MPLDTTNILTVSSAKKIVTACNDDIEANQSLNVEDVDDYLSLYFVDLNVNHAALYIAGFVEMRVLQRLTCESCFMLLNECDEAYSDFIARKICGSLRFPRSDIFTVATIVEKVYNMCRIQNDLRSKNAYGKMIVTVFRSLNLNIFKNFDCHVQDLDFLQNHKYELIKLIIKLYLDVKLYYYGKSVTLRLHDNFVRHTNTKLIIFKGQ
jgi:hypothetical protein